MMIRLTTLHLDALQKDWLHRVQSTLVNQASGNAYRNDIEAAIFEDDISDEFLAHIKETFDTSDFDDTDLIEWIRILQDDAVINTPLVPVSLEQFIFDRFNNSQTEFANAQGVKKQQVTKWIKDGFFVVDNQLCSKRRDLVVI